MNYFIGIDGGGTKTRFQCYDINGELAGETVSGGTFYRQDGVSAVIDVLKDGIGHLLKGIAAADVLGICFGMPGYGEDAHNDTIVAQKISEALYPHRIFFENDVAIGWASALAFYPGVVVVAGTGSIGYGQDANAKIVRSGGWSIFFSDEGSGYWLGRKTLELFSKQSDGRLLRGPLYNCIRSYFNIQDDFEIIRIVENQYIGDRAKIASLQRILYRSANMEDASAIRAYAEAAEELSSIICAVAGQLDFSGQSIPVSYVGGLFNLKDLVLEPMKKAVLRTIDAKFHEPRLTPCAGAVLFAAHKLMDEASFSKLRDDLLRTQ
jgi:Predicted N-acetylglucosamine kinase